MLLVSIDFFVLYIEKTFPIQWKRVKTDISVAVAGGDRGRAARSDWNTLMQ